MLKLDALIKAAAVVENKAFPDAQSNFLARTAFPVRIPKIIISPSSLSPAVSLGNYVTDAISRYGLVGNQQVMKSNGGLVRRLPTKFDF